LKDTVKEMGKEKDEITSSYLERGKSPTESPLMRRIEKGLKDLGG
jgi:hypothetical protein